MGIVTFTRRRVVFQLLGLLYPGLPKPSLFVISAL